MMLAKVAAKVSAPRQVPPRVWRGTGVFSARITDFVKKGFGDLAAIHPPTGFFRKATRCGSSLDSTDSMVHGSHDSTTRDVNRRVLCWVQNSEASNFALLLLDDISNVGATEKGCPTPIATCALASLLHAPRVDATVEHSR